MRCAGSADSHRVRIRTCPSEGRGIGASFQRTSSPVNLPAGRAFKIHWRLLLSVMGCPPKRTEPQPRPRTASARSGDCAGSLRFPLAVALKPTCEAVESGWRSDETKAARRVPREDRPLTGSPHDLYKTGR